MAVSSEIHFADDMIGDPNDLDDLIEATGRDLMDVSGDEERRQSEAEEDGQGSDNERQGSDDDGENEKKDGKAVDPLKQKKKIGPRLTLNPDRLKGPRGLTAVLKEFENFKFRGKGKEKDDLERVLAKLEHWGHRLQPKMHFEDFITKAEKLCTKKKEMQVYMNRMRMGLETGDDDIIREVDDDEEEEEAPKAGQNEALNEFDRLLDEQISYYNENPREPPRTPKTPSTLPPSPAFVPLMASTVTAEQKELIARKKREAMGRRLARLQVKEEELLREATAASLATAVEETSGDVVPSVSAPKPDIQVPSYNTELSAERERAARNRQLALERLRARKLASQGIQQPAPDLNDSSTSDLAVPLSPSGSLASPKVSNPPKSPIKSLVTSSPTKEVVKDSNKCQESLSEKTHETGDTVSSEGINSRHIVSDRIDDADEIVSSDTSLSRKELPSTSEKSGEPVRKKVSPQKDANQQKMDEDNDVSFKENLPRSVDVVASSEKIEESDNTTVFLQKNPSHQDKLSLWEKMDETDE